MTRLPELIAEIIAIDNARRAERKSHKTHGSDVSANEISVDPSPIEAMREDAPVDAPALGANSHTVSQGAASDRDSSGDDSSPDTAAVGAQADEVLPIEAPASSIPCESVDAEPQKAASIDAATPPAPSDAASAPVVASIISGVIQELTLADAIRMQDELEARYIAEMNGETAAVVEHKAASPPAVFDADDATKNRGKCCKTLQNDAADG